MRSYCTGEQGRPLIQQVWVLKRREKMQRGARTERRTCVKTRLTKAM